MNNSLNYQQNRLRPAIITFVCFMVGLIIIGILGASGIFHHNPYGNQIKITNFSRIFKDAPEQNRDAIFASLYQTVQENNVDNLDLSTIKTAYIRKDSASINYNEAEDITYAEFIVDIPDAKQSYQGTFYWSNDDNNGSIEGYNNVIRCLPESKLIYPSFGCKDVFNQNTYNQLSDKYPFLNKLPIFDGYYAGDNFTDYTSYSIRYETNEKGDELIALIITDKTGNSYDAAIKRLQEIGVDTNKITIRYKDESQEYSAPGRPDDIVDL